jgi:hypothetical protein
MGVFFGKQFFIIIVCNSINTPAAKSVYQHDRTASQRCKTRPCLSEKLSSQNIHTTEIT